MSKHLFSCLLLCQLALGAISWDAGASSEPAAQDVQPEKGPHRGRLLRQGDFTLELAIFETGVPPEFRVWFSKGDQGIPPQEVQLKVRLIRLGGVVDNIDFTPEGDYLRGGTVIYEPHSFEVAISARHQGQEYSWHYDNFEGRTQIPGDLADTMGITTETAGPAVLHETLPAYGQLVLPPTARRQIQARFEGEIRQVHVEQGQQIKKGQPLLTIESNESLKNYTLRSPIDGVVTQRLASEGEQTAGRILLTLASPVLRAELAVYPLDLDKVRLGQPVTLTLDGLPGGLKGTLSGVSPVTRADQARLFWVELDNSASTLSPGQFVTAQIETDSYEVPLAVRRTGLQGFRDFTVVYAKVGEQYEVRMLELGRQAGPWAEVLGGLKPGTEYVTDNSYILKADIEKSGASHDH